MRIKIRLLILISIIVGILSGMTLILWAAIASFKDFAQADNRMSQIFSQEQILKSGDRLVEQGLYAQALEKYEEALQPKYLGREHDKTSPLFRKVRLYRVWGRYKEALTELDNFLKAANSKTDPDIKRELKALLTSSTTHSDEAVRDYIKYLQNTNVDRLPPKGYGVSAGIVISDILRLYDTIGDYDGGIRFVDEILDWAYKKDDEEIGSLKGRINTAEEATACMKLDYEVAKERGLDRAACKWLREYLLVREAFEQDKREGKKGRATRALIQSDYFPW